MLNLQRQALFLPMQCYAFALFCRVDIQLVRNYFENTLKKVCSYQNRLYICISN